MEKLVYSAHFSRSSKKRVRQQLGSSYFHFSSEQTSEGRATLRRKRNESQKKKKKKKTDFSQTFVLFSLRCHCSELSVKNRFHLVKERKKALINVYFSSKKTH
jgi:high-affinity K+ transport system ATPase subunit B